MAGDFHVGFPATAGTEVRPTTISHVEDEGPNATNPSSHTDYQIMLSSGGRIRVTRANTEGAPVVGDVYPSTQEASRFSYEVGAEAYKQHHLYPKHNMWPVEDQTPRLDHDAPIVANNNPAAIMKVDIIQDLPYNPSSYIKRVTLVSGQTVTCAVSTQTVIGREIGQSTGTDFSETGQDPLVWCEFMAVLTLAKYDEGTVGGFIEDPYPFWQ
jgi:hypothetical protein